MKINWKVRLKNPYFWIGLVGIILTAVDVNPETLTSWGALKDTFMHIVENPFMLATVGMALIGYIPDHTTHGFCDSTRAMNYEEPRKDWQIK